MTALLNRIFVSPLPALAFLAVFALCGDVLTAAVAATCLAVGQLILVLSSHRRPDAVLLLSTALIVLLSTIALSGQDAAAAANWFPIDAVCEVGHCTCAMPHFAI